MISSQEPLKEIDEKSTSYTALCHGLYIGKKHRKWSFILVSEEIGRVKSECEERGESFQWHRKNISQR